MPTLYDRIFRSYKPIPALIITLLVLVYDIYSIAKGEGNILIGFVVLVIMIAAFISATIAGFKPILNDRRGRQIYEEKKRRKSQKRRYDSAYALFEDNKHREAINEFSVLLAEGENNSIADNCQYWIGAAHYELGDYQGAIDELGKVFDYPNSNKISDAIFLLGQACQKDGQKNLAKLQYEKLITDFPNYRDIKRVREYLNKLQ